MYSCCGSECKELLASLGGREVAQALDDPALVVALTKFRRRVPLFFDVLEYPDPQHLLFQHANEPFDTAVGVSRGLRSNVTVKDGEFVTHPYHPWCGHEFELIDHQQTLGENHVSFHDKEGRLIALPAGFFLC